MTEQPIERRQNVTQRECDIQHKALNGYVEAINRRQESAFKLLIGALVGIICNMAGVIFILVVK